MDLSTATLQRRYARCGKPSCRKCAGDGPGHGPYWYAYQRDGERVRTRYIGRRLPPALQGELELHGGGAIYRLGDLHYCPGCIAGYGILGPHAEAEMARQGIERIRLNRSNVGRYRDHSCIVCNAPLVG